MHRAGCPDANVLAAYADGALPARRAAEIHEHVAGCSVCLDVVGAVMVVTDPETAREPVMPGTGPEEVSSWRSAGLMLALAAAVVLAVVVPEWWEPRLGRGPKLADLAVATGQGRIVEGRLTGGFTHHPWFAPLAGGQGGALTSSTTIQLVAGKIREDLDRGPTPGRSHDYGVAQALLGHWDQAVLALNAAAREDSTGAAYHADAAAVLLERARRTGSSQDIARAVAAAERARRADPGLPEAWFNYALALERLSLRPQATRAWNRYLTLDAASPWAAEARGHLERLAAIPAPADWGDISARLRTGAAVADARTAVTQRPAETRLLLETDLWPAWARAVLDGGTGEAERERLRTVGDAFFDVTGDALYRDAVVALDRAEARGAIRDFAAAHADYAAAAALVSQNRFDLAAEGMSDARSRLAALGSPFAARAESEWAGIRYYRRQTEGVSQGLDPVIAAARSSQYRYVVSRALWVQGLIAFDESAYGRARACWEAMLQASTEAGDVEQSAAAHSLLANLHYLLADSNRAWDHRLESLARLEAIGLPAIRFGVLVSAAGHALNEVGPSAALALQAAVIDAAQATGRPAPLIEGLLQRSAMHLALDMLDEAGDDLTNARQIFDALDDTTVRARLEPGMLLAEVEWQQARGDADAPTATANAIRLTEAHGDRVRLARLLSIQSDLRLARGNLAGAMASATAGLAQLPSAQPGELPTSYRAERQRLLDRALRLALLQNQDEDAFRYADMARALSGGTGGGAPQSLRALRERLAPGEAVLAINQLDDALVVWAITSGHVSHVIRPLSRSEATRLVLHQADEITMTRTPRAAGVLYRELVRPLAPALGGVTRVTVAPDAPYFAASFAGLWDTTRARFWVEDVVIAVTTDLARIGRADAPALTTAAIIGIDPSATSAAAFATWRQAPANAILEVPAPMAANDDAPGLSRVEFRDDPGRPYSGVRLARDLADLPRVRAVVMPSVDPGPRPTAGTGTYAVASQVLDTGTTSVVTTVAPVPDPGAWASALAPRLSSSESVVSAVARYQRDAVRASPNRLGSWSRVVVYGAGH
ncbi:MAG: zf-HC2 domain-containing protein [Vicinamibacterales bacterium]